MIILEKCSNCKHFNYLNIKNTNTLIYQKPIYYNKHKYCNKNECVKEIELLKKINRYEEK